MMYTLKQNQLENFLQRSEDRLEQLELLLATIKPLYEGLVDDVRKSRNEISNIREDRPN